MIDHTVTLFHPPGGRFFQDTVQNMYLIMSLLNTALRGITVFLTLLMLPTSFSPPPLLPITVPYASTFTTFSLSPLSLSLPFGSSVAVEGGRNFVAVFNRRLKLVSLNVNGLRIDPKRRAIFTELRALKADIYLLQETHSTHKDSRIWSSEWGGKILFLHGLSNSRGVAVLVARDFDLPLTQLHVDLEGRLIIFKISLE